MSEPSSTRYPGARSFQDTNLDRQLFRGREEEKAALLHLVLSERLVVVYARSGVGKSSLINAGLLEPLRAEAYIPLVGRVNDPSRGAFGPLYEHIEEGARREGVEYVKGDQKSLWRFFKTAEFWRGDLLLTPVLIIDQFEELFTLLSREQREEFIGQFADLVRGRPPRAEPTPSEAPDPSALGDAPPSVKIVLSLREDFLPHLRELYVKIPNIHHTHFPLTTLGRQQARRAIEEPAALQVGELRTPRFEYAPNTVDQLIDFLCQRRVGDQLISGDEVEPFQLQLICQHVERMVDARARDAKDPLSISFADLGGEPGLRQIIANFYADEVRAMAPRYSRRAIAKLCEDGLVSPSGWRLSVEAGELTARFKVPIEALDELVDRRLLRSERRLASVYYELSHDTLLAPVVAARSRRRRSRRQLLTAAAVGLAVLVGGSQWYFLDRAERRVQLREDARKVDDIAKKDPGGALIQALDVAARGRDLYASAPPEVVGALATAVDLATVHADVVIPEVQAGAPADLHPSGEFLVVGRKDGHVAIKDLAGAEVAVTADGHGGPVVAVAFREDGAEFVSLGADGFVRLWSWEGDSLRDPIDVGKAGATRLALEPGGALAAVGGPAIATRIIDLESGRVRVLGDDAFAQSLVFGSGRTLAVLSAGEKDVDLWEIDESGAPTGGPARVGLPPSTARSVSRSEDGQRYAIADARGTVHVLARDGTSVWKTDGGAGTGRTALDRQGRVLAVTRGDLVEVYREGKTAPEEKFQGAARFFGLALSADGNRIFAGDYGGYLCAFFARESGVQNAAGEGPASDVPRPAGDGGLSSDWESSREACGGGVNLPPGSSGSLHASFITSVVLTKRFILSSGLDSKLKILALESGELLKTVEFESGIATLLVGADERSVVVGTTSGDLWIVDLSNPARGAKRRLLKRVPIPPDVNSDGERKVIEALGINRDGTRIASLSAEGIVAVHSLATGALNWSGRLPREFPSPRVDWNVGAPLELSDDGAKVSHIFAGGVRIETMAPLPPDTEAVARPEAVLLRAPTIRRLTVDDGRRELLALDTDGTAWTHDLDSGGGDFFEASDRLTEYASSGGIRSVHLATEADEILLALEDGSVLRQPENRQVASGVGELLSARISLDHRIASILEVSGKLQSFALSGIHDHEFPETSGDAEAASAIVHDGLMVAGDSDGLWKTDLTLRPMSHEDGGSACEDVVQIEAHPTAPWFLVRCDSGTVEGWDLTMDRVVDDVIERVFGSALLSSRLKPASAPIEPGRTTSMALSPDAAYTVLGTSTGLLFLLSSPWEPLASAESGRPVPFVSLGSAGIASIAISPDAKNLAVGQADGVLRVCQLGEALRCSDHQNETPHGVGPVYVTFAADGRSLLSGGVDNRLLRWSLDLEPVPWIDEKGVAKIVDQASPVTAVAAGPEIIATAPEYGPVTLWTSSGDEIATLASWELGRAPQLRFDSGPPDQLFASSGDTVVRRFELGQERWLRVICARAAPILHSRRARSTAAPEGEKLDSAIHLCEQMPSMFDPTAPGTAIPMGGLLELRSALHEHADPNLTNRDGVDLLTRSIEQGDVAAARLLIGAGARIDRVDALGRTRLHEAAWTGAVPIVDDLLRHGIDVSARDRGGATPLHYAAYQGHDAVVDALVRAGADVDAADERGTTPLMLAARAGHPSTVASLLDLEAKPAPADAEGRTAMTWARHSGDESMANQLAESAEGEAPGNWTDDRDREPAFSIEDEVLPILPQTLVAERDAILSWQTDGRKPQDRETFLRIERSGNAGDLFATYLVGRAYHYGLAVERDRSRSVKMYREAAEGGVGFAQAALALAIHNGQGATPNRAEAKSWLSRAAASGNDWAAVLLAGSLDEGRLDVEDKQQAFVEMQRLSDRGVRRAVNWVGTMYESGSGVDADIGLAVEHYRRAAALGLSSGFCNLSLYYLSGVSGVVERDVERAVWLAEECGRTAERAGMSRRHLARIRALGLDGRPADAKAARQLIENVAETDSWALHDLAWRIEDSDHSERSRAEAVRFYRLSASRGFNVAETRLKYLRVTP